MAVRTGRPRDTRLDTAIADSVERILLADGYQALTVERVAADAGTTRAALYRRHNGRASMVTGLLVARFGTQVTFDTGTLRSDLEELQRQQVLLLSAPIVRAAIPGLLGDIASSPALSDAFHAGFVVPWRESLAELLSRAVARAEVAATSAATTELVADQLSGPLLLHAVLPALGPVSDELVTATVDSALRSLGANGTGGATSVRRE